jgi:hypothetical protein
MIKIIILVAIAILMLTSCAGQITMIEYDYGVPVKQTVIHILVAPSPMPVDAMPPAFQPIRFRQSLCGKNSKHTRHLASADIPNCIDLQHTVFQ